MKWEKIGYILVVALLAWLFVQFIAWPMAQFMFLDDVRLKFFDVIISNAPISSWIAHLLALIFALTVVLGAYTALTSGSDRVRRVVGALVALLGMSAFLFSMEYWTRGSFVTADGEWKWYCIDGRDVKLYEVSGVCLNGDARARVNKNVALVLRRLAEGDIRTLSVDSVQKSGMIDPISGDPTVWVTVSGRQCEYWDAPIWHPATGQRARPLVAELFAQCLKQTHVEWELSGRSDLSDGF